MLSDDSLKHEVLKSLRKLVKRGKIRVYGFVIMPNHIHLIWRNLEINGKEFPDESFKKFTSHVFKKSLIRNAPHLLEKFRVDKVDRKYQFWKRNSLPVEILSREMLEQKLDYLHLNPLQAHWNIVNDPTDYAFSSASFYEKLDRTIDWLTDYRDDF